MLEGIHCHLMTIKLSFHKLCPDVYYITVPLCFLTFQCKDVNISQFFHIRYHFEVSNSLGSVEGFLTLEVLDGEGEGGNNKELKFDSNPVTQKEFGEYVASLHSCNNSTFILQYQV